jgi:hypothetical protein
MQKTQCPGTNTTTGNQTGKCLNSSGDDYEIGMRFAK